MTPRIPTPYKPPEKRLPHGSGFVIALGFGLAFWALVGGLW